MNFKYLPGDRKNGMSQNKDPTINIDIYNLNFSRTINNAVLGRGLNHLLFKILVF